MEEKEWQELEGLQRKHIHETGRRFVMPLRLGWPKPWAVDGEGKT